MSKWVPGVVCLAVLIGCGGGGSHPTGSGGSSNGGNGGSGARCVPGDSKSCTGPGPCAGYQVCQGDGTYGACNCATGGTGGGAGGAGGSAGSIAGTGGRGGAGGSAAGTGGSAGTGGQISCTVDAAAGDDGAATVPDAGRDAYVSDGPSSAAAFQSFCAAMRSSMIARNERCVGFTHVQAVGVVKNDPCGAWGWALDRGFMSFDATNAGSCVAAIDALSCAVAAAPAACDGVLTGHIANYGGLPDPGCSYAPQLTSVGLTTPATAGIFTECMPGSFCVDHSKSPGPPAICAPLPKLGDACTAGVRCAAGACDHTGHCATPKSSGDACTNGSDCASGLYCGSNSTCAAKHASGSCSSSTECIPPATCDSGSCGIRPRGVCCAAQTDCATAEACPARGGICSPRPIIGQACEPDTGGVCVTGICDPGTKVCRPTSPGSFCADDTWCGSDAICVPDFGGSFECAGLVY